MRESEELLEKARAHVTAAIQAANVSLEGDQHRVDWQFVKNKIRDTLSKYVYEQTRRRPMILPVVMEV